MIDLKVSEKQFVSICHKTEHIPVICLITYFVVGVLKLIYLRSYFQPQGYIKAYVQDKQASDFIKIFQRCLRPTPHALGIRESVVYALDHKAKNEKQALAYQKQLIRFELFQQSLRDFEKDPHLLRHTLLVDPVNTLRLHQSTLLNQNMILKLLSFNGRILWYLRTHEKNNKELVRIACSNTGEALRDANPLFMNDKEMVLIAAKTFPDIYPLISNQLRQDQDIALLITSLKPSLFPTIDITHRTSHSFKSRLLEIKGFCLRFMSPEDQNNDKLVEGAVNQNGLSLEYASLRLRHSYKIVRLAYLQNPMSLDFATESFKAIAQLVTTMYVKLDRNQKDFEDDDKKRLVFELMLYNG